MTTLIFVRHGQSQSNLEKRFTGQGNTELTKLGRMQAERTAAFLKDYPIEAVYASDLNRAMDTARPTAQMHGLEVIPDPMLREVNAGLWEEKPYDELLDVLAAESAVDDAVCGVNKLDRLERADARPL